MKEHINLKTTRKKLLQKTMLLSLWGCSDITSWTYQSGYLPLKDMFGELIVFDPRQKRLELGSHEMKQKLFEIIERKKPDYFFFMPDAHELNIDTIQRINALSPNTKTIVHFGDDDVHFHSRSRYYALFIDYFLIGLGQYVPLYHKDGLTNAFPLTDAINTTHFRPLSTKKIYDVTFVGTPFPPYRAELMKYLLDNGVKLRIWGRGWEQYPELQKIYGGAIDLDEYVKVINQTKITLAPSRSQYGKPHMTGRVYEVAACKAFSLTDYHTEYLTHFGREFEPALFKNNKNLLRKIRYFLANEKNRHHIANQAHKKVIKNHDMKTELTKFFSHVIKNEDTFKRTPPTPSKEKIITLTKKDLQLSKKEITHKLKPFDTISFSLTNKAINPLRDTLLSRALAVTGKQISCCDYLVSSQRIGTYLSFNARTHIELSDPGKKSKLLHLDQLMMTKKYFLNNIDTIYSTNPDMHLSFITKKNTAFVSIPLVTKELTKAQITEINTLDDYSLQRRFQLVFLHRIRSLAHRKKYGDPYLYWFLMNAILENSFLSRYIWEKMLTKDNIKNLLRTKF